MPNTYTQIYIQIVFAVKGREHFIKEPFREELQKYMTGIINNKKQKLYAIYCMPDHTHLLVSMKPDLSISDLARDIKSNSSSFLKDKKIVPESFSWQEGFGAFSYSKSQAPTVVNYILNQPEHHTRKTFQQEYVEFLEKFEIDFSPKYLFEFYD
ncbi:IS200/IS605 family transposase [Lacibacter sp. H407]|uniref:IS200/IS605 family transposase n=1 Tax=Lacibacter sp. H407 TaxID=3133423 RepID=UPI0030BBCA97